ncbi:uncharacterized protein LOC142334184 [Lycorma delicatula]|uniref:uncharacterized protein LOC142334184 n=1 Tax=Lycorma delicatula TaxID=130591 RepID=UPI003F5169E7
MEIHNAILCLIFLTVCRSGESLKCYDCKSDSNNDCLDGENLNKKYEADCSTLKNAADVFNTVSGGISDITSAFGVKFDAPKIDPEHVTCQKVEITDSEDKKTVIRTCSLDVMNSEDTCSYLESKLGNSKTKISCTQCKSDLCNSSMNLLPSTFALIILVVFSAFFSL